MMRVLPALAQDCGRDGPRLLEQMVQCASARPVHGCAGGAFDCFQIEDPRFLRSPANNTWRSWSSGPATSCRIASVIFFLRCQSVLKRYGPDRPVAGSGSADSATPSGACDGIPWQIARLADLPPNGGTQVRRLRKKHRFGSLLCRAPVLPAVLRSGPHCGSINP